MHHPVPFCALEAQNDVWKQIVPHGHRLFRKHGYGPNMMRCQSLLGLDGCSRVPTHLKLVTLVPLQSRQRPSQVVQLSEQLECILSRSLSEVDSLSARSVVDALFDSHYAPATGLAWPNFDCEWMKILVREGGGKTVCNFVYVLHLATFPFWQSAWCERSEASAGMNSNRH